MATVNTVPGWEGSIGPFPAQYKSLHVYARDVNSGSGNCVCGSVLGDGLHVQAAPGVAVPDRLRLHADEHLRMMAICLCTCKLCMAEDENSCICPACELKGNRIEHFH